MKNWTIKEAVEAINKNDAAAIKEISKHFPMFFLAIARNDLQALAAMMPEKFTVRRLQMTDAAADDADEGAEPQTDADAEDASEDAGEADLSSMSTKELMKLCDKRGIKVPHYGKNKQFYLDALNGASGAKDEDEADADEDGEDEGSNPYEGKNAMELYKMCKKRGIKCEAKKKASYYADLLTKDDAKSDEGEDESEDDGWGDEDEAQEEPKKAAKSSKKAEKADKKPAAKAAKKETKKDEADDDDDWDI